MSHQVLSNRQFSGFADTQEESEIGTPEAEVLTPEKEDENVGEKPN